MKIRIPRSSPVKPAAPGGGGPGGSGGGTAAETGAPTGKTHPAGAWAAAVTAAPQAAVAVPAPGAAEPLSALSTVHAFGAEA